MLAVILPNYYVAVYWPVKTAPSIALALGVDTDKVAALLSEHVYEQLRELGEPQPDFRGG